ncbi:MAG: hypothetical protein Q8P68_04010 [Candidatus Peregrinibacteria bacterium]|nr:hypothetical protein [Candidatus Peregrinibacteria bacterium]MDZ4245301.1 hypothetical protein [Candidatus Gracilibacteria bacterium]
MTTKFIGMKEFRDNLAGTIKKARKGNITYIVLKKNVPVCEIKPIDEKEFAMQRFAKELDEAMAQVKQGKVYSQEEVMKEFGLL